MAYDPTTHARSSDPATSHASAAAATSFVGTHCDRIIAALTTHGPMTKDEIASRAGLSPVQVDRRLPDLMADGRASPTGDIGQSFSGRPERVWASTETTQ